MIQVGIEGYKKGPEGPTSRTVLVLLFRRAFVARFSGSGFADLRVIVRRGPVGAIGARVPRVAPFLSSILRGHGSLRSWNENVVDAEKLPLEKTPAKLYPTLSNWPRVLWKLLLRRFRFIPNFCRCCGRDVHDYIAPRDVWEKVQPSIILGCTLCYDCFCEACKRINAQSVWRLL